MNNYEEVNDKKIFLDNEIGGLIGLYKNSKPIYQILHIYESGIAWTAEERPNLFLYKDVVDIKLPDGKQSLALQIFTNSGFYILPVAGHDEKFFDSLEMLRFLRRVVDDILSGREL
ncbi:hypothetical protein [Agrobacterium vitis]|uniref:hypothetical protein n=1 Tax=Agrobacterium vitis TaxID=373 RepID=UPI003D28B94B